MARQELGRNVVITLDANEETVVVLPTHAQNFSVLLHPVNPTHNVFFRFDGGVAAENSTECHPISATVQGYDRLYRRNPITEISFFSTQSTQLIIYNVN